MYTIIFIILEEVQSAKQWLLTDGLNSDFSSIKEKWTLTYDIRRNDIFNSNEYSILDILLKWPIFQSPIGYQLV